MKPLLFVLLYSAFVFGQVSETDDALCRQARQETLHPIRPGRPGVRPFWNEKAIMFKYAPAFDNPVSSWIVADPDFYRYTAFSYSDKKEYVFTAQTPFEALSPIWENLPAGRIDLKVEAVSADGLDRVLAGQHSFTKTAAFCPPYPPARHSYSEALVKGLRFLILQPHIRHWYEQGLPDHKTHPLYCYPAKEIGSVIDGMLLYETYFPGNDSALVIARRAADYILATAEPAGAALEFFPQIYEGTNLQAGRFGSEMIMVEPAVTGKTLLRLYDRTGLEKYLQAAGRIAETYRRTQLTTGTWPLRLNREKGQPVTDVLCIPTGIYEFLNLLAEKYDQPQFRLAAKSALNWIWQNPVQTFDWTGQFEDVAAAAPYQNLTKYEAAWFARYLLAHKQQDQSYQPLAVELMAFCEDQFVVWENPGIYDNWNNYSGRWQTPAVLEQYQCYVPIDASSAEMAVTFFEAWEQTGQGIYREKALTLANSIVTAQDENGRIPTFWVPGFSEFWQNCMVSSLYALHKVNSGKGSAPQK